MFTMDFDIKKVIGIIAFIVGILLIVFSQAIPISSIFIYVTGVLLIVYAVLSFL